MYTIAEWGLFRVHYRTLFLKALNGKAAGTINARNPQYYESGAMLLGPLFKLLLCIYPAYCALGYRCGGTAFINPFAVTVAVNATGADVDQRVDCVQMRYQAAHT